MKTIEKFRLTYLLHDNEGTDVTDTKLIGIVPEWAASGAAVKLRVSPDGRFADVLGRSPGLSNVSASAVVDGNVEEVAIDVEISEADVLNSSFAAGPVEVQNEEDLGF